MFKQAPTLHPESCEQKEQKLLYLIGIDIDICPIHLVELPGFHIMVSKLNP